MDLELNGKTAIVTGASKGIGNRLHVMPVFQALNLKTIGSEAIQHAFTLSC